MNLLSIGGSDPSSGAGIQSDIRSFSSLGAYGLTVVTAITGQNTSRFGIVEPVSKKILKNQLDLLVSDFVIDGIKISMVYNSKIIKTIFNAIQKLSCPIILDPVIKSTTGGMLIENTAVKEFKKYLIPNSTVITPNKSEAEFLTKISINNTEDLKKVGEKLLKLGTKNVVITGIDFEKNYIIDFVINEKNFHLIKNEKLASINHGSGGNHSAAMTFAIAQGKSILDAAKFAQKFTFDSIKSSKKIGKGIEITLSKPDKNYLELSKAITKFTHLNNIANAIPECQTNFVFSKKSPKSLLDVLGISGRIVKSGDHVIKAGNLQYGGSKHVATAVITMNKKFEQIRSAINIKFDKQTISALEKNGFNVKNYNRTKEPKGIKNKEGSSIEWGVSSAIRNSKQPPDAIFHKGDFGKEPMIIIFGESPKTVLRKVSQIFSKM